MANITIGGGSGSVFKDAIPSALQFTSWDNYQWFQQGGQGFNINYQNFYYNPVYFHHVQDVENRKFFAIPQGMGSKNDYKYRSQSPIGCYKYDHLNNTSQFIEFDEGDVYDLRNKWGASGNNNYENLVYDETTNRLFWLCYSDNTLYEIDQTTGQITQKTTCTLASTIQSVVANNGYLYVIDANKDFARYNISTNSWSSLNAMSGYSHSMSQGYARLLTDGSNWIVFVPYQAMSNASYPLMKYSISGGTWAAATITNAPSGSSYYISEIFNGFVYVHYMTNTNNYSSIWKYNLASDVWTASALNLQSKGLTSGGSYGMFRANSKLYWVGSYLVADYNGTRSMQKHEIWEMDTSENFTLATSKFLPVEAGEWCYNQNGGYEQHMMHLQKSCGRYQFFNSFHSYSRGFRYIPYIDPFNKTVEWIRMPSETNKEVDWCGWAAIVKNGKLYVMNAKTFDLWECQIGTWTWTKKDNLYTRIGNKMPYSCNGDSWYYGCGTNYSNGATPWQLLGGLFTVKEDTEDIYLLTPRYGNDEYVYVYKFDVSANQWSVLNSSGVMSQADFGNGNSNSTYSNYKNHVVESNQNSSWLLLMIYCYNDGNSQRYTQRFYAFNPVDGTFQHMTGQDTSSWYGAYGFTTDGKPIWHTSSSASKVYYNDMETMPYDVTNKYLEQVLNNQDQYIYMNSIQSTSLIMHINPDNFEEGFALRINSSSNQGAVYQEWGFLQQIDALKGGYLLGWSRNASLSSPYRYGRIMIDNDGVRSVIVNDALPSSVVDSATVFTTKVKKNFKLYLEFWCYNNGLVTFFAPTN